MATHSSGFLMPEKSHGQRSLAGYSPWDRKESDMTQATQHACMHPSYLSKGASFTLIKSQRSRTQGQRSVMSQTIFALNRQMCNCPPCLKLKKLCVCVLIHSVVSNSLRPFGLQPTRLLLPWDFPGKNTGVGCHFFLQGIFPTQGSNQCLLCFLHCRQILHLLSHQGSHALSQDFILELEEAY